MIRDCGRFGLVEQDQDGAYRFVQEPSRFVMDDRGEMWEVPGEMKRVPLIVKPVAGTQSHELVAAPGVAPWLETVGKKERAAMYSEMTGTPLRCWACGSTNLVNDPHCCNDCGELQ